MNKHSDNQIADIAVEIRSSTDLAYWLDDGATREWVPRSQVEITEMDDGSIIASMPMWLAKEKGFL